MMGRRYPIRDRGWIAVDGLSDHVANAVQWTANAAAEAATLGAVVRVAFILSGVLLGPGLPAAADGSAAPTIATGESAAALQARITELVGRVGDGQSPTRTRACKVNSMGFCGTQKVLREERKVRQASRVLDADEHALIAAYEAFLAAPAGAAAPEAPAYRYHLARLLTDLGEAARARPHLELLTDGSDASRRAAWAAMLLIDGLVRAWTESPREQRDGGRLDLERALARLRTTSMWPTDAALELRALSLTLDAGLWWAQAQAQFERGRDAKDPDAAAAAFAACGREFEAIHAELWDRHDRASELLWNAGRCFEAAHDVEAALRLYAALVERYPGSELGANTLFHIAEIHDGQARHREAVGWYERFVAAAPRHIHHADALRRVAELRAALGPHERRVAALAAYEAYYARLDPRRAAEIRWYAYAQAPRNNAERRAHLAMLLRDHGRQAVPALRPRAEAELARILLLGTCPKELVLGSLCVTGSPGRAVVLSEGSGFSRRYATTRWSSPRRNGADLEEALQHAEAVRAYTRGTRGTRGQRSDELSAALAAEAVAAAALLEADVAFEAILTGRPSPPRPRPLRLTGEEVARGVAPAVPTPRLALAARAGLAGAVAEDVDAVDEAYSVIEEFFADSASATRAWARRGLLREWLAERVLLAATPDSIDRPAFDELRAAAIAAYRACLAPTPASLAASESTAYCERRLAARSPGDPAVVAELLGTEPPGYPADRPVVEGPVLAVDEALRLGARAVAGDSPPERPDGDAP